MNFKDANTGEGYDKHTRRNFILNALIEFERMSEIHRSMPLNFGERLHCTQAEFCTAITHIAHCQDFDVNGHWQEVGLMSEPVTLEEINRILERPLYEVLNLPAYEGLKR